ncbi:NAD(P)-binding protein, partial [Streptomyces sp. NPDC002491]
MSERRPVLAVIGAGPAGLAAAQAAAARGVRVVLIDSAAEAGGQFYRQPARGLGARRPEALHHQWRTWKRLRAGLDAQITAGRVIEPARHADRGRRLPGAEGPRHHREEGALGGRR